MASLFHMHPSAPDHILARVTRKACDAADAETSGGACGHDLMYSPDFGRTWVNLRKNSRGASGASSISTGPRPGAGP